MNSKPAKAKKQSYHRPQVSDYGSIKDITANNTQQFTIDAGASGRKT